jgi:hypothetical protein
MTTKQPHGRDCPDRCSICLGIAPSISKSLGTIPEGLLVDEIVEDFTPRETADDAHRKTVAQNGAAARHGKPTTKLTPSEVGRVAALARWAAIRAAKPIATKTIATKPIATVDEQERIAQARDQRWTVQAPDGFVSVPEYAEQTGIPSRTVRSRIKNKILDVQRVNGRVWVAAPEVVS